MAFRRVISLPSMPPRVLTLTPSTFLSGRVKSNPTFFCRSSSSSGSFESKKWQGRWNNERWGVGDPITQLAAKPVGVELTAFPEAEVDSTWGNLTHALSVLFCASINFLELPTTFLGPWFSSRPEANRTGGGGAFDAPGMKRVVKGKKWSKSLMTRYGALPREALCRTPRLTPWLTLLPCRDKAGLTTLLDRQTIYSGMYHSQRLLITSGDFDRDEEGTTLEQVVFRKLQDWTLSSMFGSKLVGKCPLATTSSVYLELEKSLAKHLAGDLSEETGINFADSRVFSLSPAPSRVLASSSRSLFLAHTASLISASLGQPRWIGLRLGLSSTQAGPWLAAGMQGDPSSFRFGQMMVLPGTVTLQASRQPRMIPRFRAVLGASTPHIHHPFLSRTGNSILRQLKWTKFSMCLVGLGESNKPAFSRRDCRPARA
ncbi:hypothetical protein SELMODRAFT_429514 [Selaginella moellendorffii]|uniref:Uncharacterized protein n=1 Tax=Selaginella moellendorffii TaxID=88036 RepID=D8T6F3_SELML|nr:hypothetical protein SELMODRAFT_429514 [Selaginella moellendorffii]